jgi:hypothetical protein
MSQINSMPGILGTSSILGKRDLTGQHSSTQKSARSRTTIQHDTIMTDSNVITLNYGIQIRCVFDIVNDLSVYISFVKFFLEYEKFSQANRIKYATLIDSVVTKLIDFIKIGRIDLNDYGIDGLSSLLQNGVYIQLDNIYMYRSKKFTEFFKEKFDIISSHALSSEQTEEQTKEQKEEYKQIFKFFDDFKDLIKLVVGIIEQHVKNNLLRRENANNLIKILDATIKSLVVGKNFSDYLKGCFDVSKHANLKILYDDDSVDEFYNEARHGRDDTLWILFKKDYSVNCTNLDLYYNPYDSSPQFFFKYDYFKYRFLLNSCLFITDVFKTPDEINKKLAYFFGNNYVKKTIRNCKNTSNHTHISFNKLIDGRNQNIKPDIKIIFALLIICHYYQDKLYNLFLNTRIINSDCKKLVFRPKDEHIIEFKEEYTQDEYDDYLKVLFDTFYEGSDDSTIKDNRYFWLNIVNLYKLTSGRVPTVEFRIQHGSDDPEEISKACILYNNLIKYAIELSRLINSGISIHNILNLSILSQFLILD